jgi:hypothetical protein
VTAYTDIRAALEQQIASVTGIPSAANRSWENVRFKPTTGTSWVRMTLQPGESRPAIRGANPVLEYIGLFLVDVFVPEGTGPNAADVLADNIRNQFAPGTDITENATTVRIRHSERADGQLDGPWYMVPVSISWYSFRT